MLLLILPGYLRLTTRNAEDGLVLSRQVFMTFLGSLILFEVVLALVGTTDAKSYPAIAVGAIVLGAVSVFGLSPLVGNPPLDCSNAEALANSYRSRFFLRIAFAESAALFGFVAFFVANVWWSYPVALISAFAGFARLAPTRANLAKDQAALQSQGCRLSLVRALRGMDK